MSKRKRPPSLDQAKPRAKIKVRSSEEFERWRKLAAEAKRKGQESGKSGLDGADRTDIS